MLVERHAREDRRGAATSNTQQRDERVGCEE
jgi:hypothetical protein